MAAAVGAAVVLSLASHSEAAWSPSRTVMRGVSLWPPLLATSPRHGATLAVRENWAKGTFVARRIFPDGTLGPRRTLAEHTNRFAGGPWIAVNRAGATVAVWFGDDGSLRARRMTPRGRLEGTLTIAPPEATGNYLQTADVSVDATGNVMIAWQAVVATDFDRPHGPSVVNSRVYARRLSAEDVLGPMIDLSADLLNYQPRVTLRPSGQASVIWKSYDGYGTRPGSLRMTTIGNDGTIGALRDIAVEAPPAYALEPDLAMDAHGRVTAVWGSREVVARRIGVDGALGPIRALGPIYASDDQLRVEVGVDRTGNATVVWQSAEIWVGTNSIQARRINVLDGLGPSWDLYDAAYGAKSPTVAVDPSGTATAAWVRVLRPPEPGVYSIKTRAIGDRGRLGKVRTLAPRTRASLLGPQAIADARGVVTVAWSDTLANRTPASVIKLRRLVPRRGR